ncbi:MAG: outer membrane protein assembly factor BamE [Pseudomonadota bacterium]
MQKILIYAGFFIALAGCAHKIEIQQGAVITEQQLSRLEIGMDWREVRQIMGTPSLTDPFHQGRWDYIYSMQKGHQPQQRYRATLFFDGESLNRIEREGPIPEEDRPQLTEEDR